MAPSPILTIDLPPTPISNPPSPTGSQEIPQNVILAAPEHLPPTPITSQLHHCGQFTFYFPRCSHATSHTFHLNTWSGNLCNRNCVYDRSINYWFYADETSLCSFCGLGSTDGIGTKQILPPDTNQKSREHFFENLIKSGKLCLGATKVGERTAYETLSIAAVHQYNQLIDLIPSLHPPPANLTPAQHRTERRKRMLDRWSIRRFRARRRTEEWVHNIRLEQYSTTKSHLPIGSRPYIVAPTGNPHMDLYTPVPAPKVPDENCAWCQYALSSPDAIKESGAANALPCGHMFHYNCIVELFERGNADGGGEREGHKCPLCKTWFRDVREIPDFYGRYRGGEREFGSQDGSSVLSGSEVGDLRGNGGPPWFEGWVDDGLREEEDGDSEGDSKGEREGSMLVDECKDFLEEAEAWRGRTEGEARRVESVRVEAGGVVLQSVEPPVTDSDPSTPSLVIEQVQEQENMRVGCGIETRIGTVIDEQSLSGSGQSRASNLGLRRTTRQSRPPRRWDDEYAEAERFAREQTW